MVLQGQFKSILVLTIGLLSPMIGYALPTDGAAVAGEAHLVSPDSSSLVITTSDKAIVNYKSFNIGEKERVQFIQPSRKSCVLNRVRGKDVSKILGKLEANGNVFLVNPNGVYFGPTSTVNVGSLIASTLNILDQDFLDEKYQFTLSQGSEKSMILNQGTISAVSKGLIALLAPHVQNDGLLLAKAGSILLASAQKIVLDFTGDGLIGFALDGELQSAFIQNSGSIQAAEGQVFVHARVASEVVKRIVNLDSFVEGVQIVCENGEIFIAPRGKVKSSNIEMAAPVVDLRGEIISTGDLNIEGKDHLCLRDSKDDPLVLAAYGDFFLKSDNIDILALSNERTALVSGGKMTLMSNNDISADGRFMSGGDFALLKPDGSSGDFKSLYDPVISATGSVTFGAYAGVSLLVQSTGRITPTGAITITAPDTVLAGGVGTDPALLKTKSSLILRAGLGALDGTYVPLNPVPPNVVTGGATFTNTGTIAGTDITFTGGTITLNAAPGPVGEVILAAPGGIFIGGVATTTINTNGGAVTISNNINADTAGRTLSIITGANGIAGSAISFGGSVGATTPFALTLSSSTGNIDFTGPVTLGGNSTISSDSGNITFPVAATINSDFLITPRTFSVSSGGAGTLSMNGVVGGMVPLGALTVTALSGNTNIDTITLGGNSTFNTGSGAINFNGTINSDTVARTLTINKNSSANSVHFFSPVGGITPLGAMTITTSSAPVTFDSTLILGGNSTITTASGSGTGTVTITGALNGDIAGRTFTINTGDGSMIFSGAIGTVQPLGAITLTTSTGSMSFANPVVLGGNSTMTSLGGGGVTFSSTLDGDVGATRTLGVNLGAGNLLCSGTVGGIAPLSTLTLATTSGNMTFSSPVTLGGTAALTTGTGLINFGSTLSSDSTARAITIIKSSSTGSVTFTGAVGASAHVGAITITTIGAPVTFASSLNFAGNSSITTHSGNLTIVGNIDADAAGRTVALDTDDGDITISGVIGSQQPLGALTFVTQGGDITLANTVILGGATSLTTVTGNVLINSLPATTINSSTLAAQSLSIQSSTGTITTGGTIGAISPLSTLSLNTSTVINVANIGGTFAGVTGATNLGNVLTPTTINFTGTSYNANAQTYNASSLFNFTNTAVMNQASADVINFNTGTITLADNLSIDSNGGTIIMGSVIRSGIGLRNLSVDAGVGAITIGAIGTALGQFDAVTLGDATASGGSLNIQGAIYANEIDLFAGSAGTIFLGGNLFTNSTPLFFGSAVQRNFITDVLISTGLPGATIMFNNTLNADLTAHTRNLTIAAGSGNVIFQSPVGALQPLDALTITSANQIRLGSTISTDTINFTATGNIVNLLTPFAITTVGTASFNSLAGTVGTLSSPLLVNSGGLIFAGSPTLADFNGTSSDNTVHPIPGNNPCVIIFNGAFIQDCTPGPGPTPPIPPVSLIPPSENVFFLPGIFSLYYNFASDFYFMPDWVDQLYLHSSGYVPLYWIKHSKPSRI